MLKPAHDYKKLHYTTGQGLLIMADNVRRCRVPETNSSKNESKTPSASSELLQSKGLLRAGTEKQKQIAICNRAKPRGMSRLNPAVTPNIQASTKLRDSESPKSSCLNGLGSSAAIDIDIDSVIQNLENQSSGVIEQPTQLSTSEVPQSSKPIAIPSKVQAVSTTIPSGTANGVLKPSEGRTNDSSVHEDGKRLAKDSAEGGTLCKAGESIAHTPAREGHVTQSSQTDGNRLSKPRVTFNIPEVSHGYSLFSGLWSLLSTNTLCWLCLSLNLLKNHK